ncbi:hypothetical protein ACFOEK_10635 [Litoribrevibacter euphylliae]|uniref:Uncharacterized protein n=1 Tax=Litoribrevibacter euphylliae TaxID=1834034 RepID=A0ABV7HFU0_9GAMM
MRMIKNLLQGFRGGPDFNEVNHLNASFENTQFSAALPYSNIETKEPPRPIHFPYLSEGWFEKHATQNRQHHYVHVDTQMWYYIPSIAYSQGGELGCLSLTTLIKRIPKNMTSSAFELDDLGKFIALEYEEHYNSPTIGGIGGEGLGINTEIRKSVIEQSERMSTPFSGEKLEEQIRLEMESRGYAPMAPHQIKTINGRSWVFCIEQQLQKRHSKDRMYCLPLSDEYYLCMRFRYRVDINEKFKLWKDHAEAAEKRIMESVKLIIPNDELALTHQA